ncbi:MAG: PaaI family thioesterase [Chloroflexi bacterium]|nr:PaaI family thioesterase [Chloroflexota bacterium]
MSDGAASQALPPERIEELRARAARARFAQTLGGLELLNVYHGRARMALRVDSRLHQDGGVVQGGIVASLADSSMAFAVMSVTEPHEPAVSIEMNINWLAPVREGEVVAEGRVIHKGSRTLLCESEVRNSSGKLVAKATATFIRPGHKASKS